jgi:hypothetical protein
MAGKTKPRRRRARRQANPPAELVYPEVISVVARKNPRGGDHKCGVRCRRGNHTYEHKFKRPRPKLYGLADGSLLIR